MCLGFQEMFYSLRSNHGKYLFGSCKVQRGDRKICRFQNGGSKHVRSEFLRTCFTTIVSAIK